MPLQRAILLSVLSGSVCMAQSIGCDLLKSVTVKVDGTELGTGVVIQHDSRTAWIATAAHVVRGKQLVTVFFSNSVRLSATVQYPLGAERSSLDIAILKVDAPGRFSTIPNLQVRTAPLMTGERVSYMGHPGDLSWQCYPDREAISRLSYQGDDRQFLFTNPVALRGLSGGPVSDMSGMLLGILVSQTPSANAIAVRISSVLAILADEVGVSVPEPAGSAPIRPTVNQPALNSAGLPQASEARMADRAKTGFTGPQGHNLGDFVISLYRCKMEGGVFQCYFTASRVDDGNLDYRYDAQDRNFSSKLIDDFKIEHQQVRGYFLNGRGQKQSSVNFAKDDPVWFVQEFDGVANDVKRVRIVFTGRAIQLSAPVQDSGH